MQTSALNERLEFQAPSKVSNDMGGFITSFTTIFTTTGAYWPLNGAEAIANMAAGGLIDGKVRIRYRPINIKTSWRIRVVSRNIYLNIAGPPVNLFGERKWFEIKVKEAA